MGSASFRLFTAFTLCLAGVALTLLSFATNSSSENMSEGRQQLKGHLTPTMSAAKVIGRVPSATEIRLSIGLSVTDPLGLATSLKNVADPTSPAYRKYLTPEQFTARFAPSTADYQSVIDWAKANHLSVVLTHPNRQLVDVSGTAADVELAFHVKLEQALRQDGSKFYRPDREPSLDLRVPILAVTGLDDFERPKHSGGSSPIGNYISKDLRRAYVPCTGLTGAGQSLGILAFDGYKPSDVAQYQTTAGIPQLVPTNVLAGGATGTPSGAFAETVADIELAMAMAPGLAHLTVYIGTTCNDRDSLLSQMTTLQPLSLQNSSSFGCGPTLTTLQLFDTMAMQGQSFFWVSGDFGGYAPNSQPFDRSKVTTVGGTILTMNGAGASYQSEVTWNDPAISRSSGGGVEGGITIPPWQAGSFSPQSGASSTNRNDPDVSMVAKDLYIYSSSPFANGFEGTSAAAPLWAGFMALVNQQNASAGLGPVWAAPAIWHIGRTPAAYALAFHDITSGTATSYLGGPNYSAVAGYDLTTGWGTPQCGLIDQLACVACNGTTASMGQPPACISLQTDPNNCGTCGNVCQPPATCVGGKCQIGGSNGDTHITTFDGLFYDFQASGDFLLVTTGPSFIVQTRQVPGLPNWPNAATNQAVAMQIGGNRVALFLPPTRLVVNGTPAQLADGTSLSLSNAVKISRAGNVYFVKRDGGESVRVDVQQTWMNVAVSLGSAPSDVRGLLGNANGNTGDDIATVDGVVLKQPVSFQDLYGRYADSLRITPRESLFGDERGIAPGTPKQPFYANNLDKARYEPARAACKAAGVSVDPLLDACTLDVVVIGTKSAAAVFATMTPPAAVMQAGSEPSQPQRDFAGLWWLLAAGAVLLILLVLARFWIRRRAS